MRLMRSGRTRGIAGLVGAIVVLGLAWLAQPASAQEVFPNKPIKMVITHGAGGSVDLPSRAMAQYMQKYLKNFPVVAENMEGGGGRRAMEYVFNDVRPDGYTIVASAFPSRLIGELLYNTKYKMSEYVHLGSWVGGDYRCTFVAMNSPFKSFKDLMEEGKKRKLNVGGGGGLGSTSQLQMVFLRELVKLNLNFVPYDSEAETTVAVLGKHIDVGTGPLSGAVKTMKNGDIRILAVHAPERVKIIPDVPTMKELGYDGVVIPDGVGAWAPPKTPKDRAKVLSDAIAKAAADPEFVKWTEKASMMLEPLGPEEFLKVTLEDYKNIGKVLHLLKTAK
jgi:tripartite-type tricarboxylate transporter receptor subunit TctC